MDQKTLDALLAKVIAQARQAGIPVSPAIDPKVRVNRRARTRFGCCIQKNGRFYIELASQLLSAREQAGVPGTGPRDTPHLPGLRQPRAEVEGLRPADERAVRLRGGADGQL